MFSADDYRYMAQALRLARKGLFTTHPNPRVGCVLVRDNTIVAEAFHERAGLPHAEALALAMAGEHAKGATAYVTLEPCSHFGRTPPCADALINAGVSRVVAAMTDPNPLVAGRGLAKLKQAGIEVSSGLLESEARALNPGFIKRMEKGLPYVRVKMAMSLDGRTAMQSGESKWITGADARQDVQQWRARSAAVITGIGTVLADDPELTVRIGTDLPQPLRVVLDSQGRMPLTAKMLQSTGPILHVTSSSVIQTEDWPTHCTTLQLNTVNNRIDLVSLLTHLAEVYQINEVLVEAGANLVGAFVEANCVDELLVYMAPTLLGSEARPLMTLPLSQMKDQKRLELDDCRLIGQDMRMTWRFLSEK